MKLDLKLLKRLYMIDHPSREEHPMISFILNYCYKIPNLTFELDHYGNLFITKNTTNPEYYACLLAHTDAIVTNRGPYGILVKDGIIRGYHKVDNTPCSLNADDSNGICVALQLLKALPDLKIVFTVEEEIGAVGAREAALNIDFLHNVKFFIQADRRGKSDLITHTNCIDVTSSEFLTDIASIMVKYGYTKARGTFTDVGEFCEALKISGCNVSCGYYSEHSVNEYTVIEDLQNCLNFIEEILLTLTSDKVYEIEIQYPWTYYGYGYSKDDDPYGLYNQFDGEYDFDWKPDEEAWDRYNDALAKAEGLHPTEIDYENIPCDTCRDMDCMHCKYLNAY